MWTPLFLSYLAWANGKIGRLDEAWTNIREAMTAVETTKERWCEAEINRIAGEVALLSPDPDTAKAESGFARALEVARKQQAKAWELRAAMSIARLLRAQGVFQHPSGTPPRTERKPLKSHIKVLSIGGVPFGADRDPALTRLFTVPSKC